MSLFFNLYDLMIIDQLCGSFYAPLNIIVMMKQGGEEEIYQSDQCQNQQMNQSQEKGTLLNKFLKKINASMEKEMFQFIVKNQQMYKQPKDKQKISIYEDILFIWTYKKEEAALNNKNTKKETVDKMLQELNEMTERKQVTIKERVEKKLCKLSFSKIKEFMISKQDIPTSEFKNDTKNSKKSNMSQTNIKGINLPSDSTLIDNSTPSSSGRQNEKGMARMNEIIARGELMRKDKNQMKEEKLNFIEDIKNGSQLVENKSIYQYGKKIVKERIFIFASAENGIYFPFKTQKIRKIMEEIDQKIQKEDKAQNTQLINENIIQKSENECQEMQIEQKPIQMINTQKMLNEKKNNKSKLAEEIIRSISKLLQKQDRKDTGSEQEQQEILSKVEQIKTKTRKALSALKQQDNNQQNSKKMAHIQEYLANIEKLQNKINKQQHHHSPSKRSESKTVIESERKQQKQIKSSNQDENLDKTQSRQASNKTSADLQAQLKQLYFSVCKNSINLQLINNDPSKRKLYVWCKEEDQTIFSFKFNPDSVVEEMTCLLRYKTIEQIRERYKFLNTQIDPNLEKELKRIQSSLEANQMKETDSKIELNEVIREDQGERMISQAEQLALQSC